MLPVASTIATASSDTPNRRLHAMRTGLILWSSALVFTGWLLSACASESPVTGPLTAPVSPLMPIDAGVTVGVLVEDLSQTQEEDNQEASALELISDCLSMPWNLAVGSVAMIGGFVWSLADYPDHTLKQRATTILEYLPYHHAAPAVYYDPKTRQTVRTP